MLDAFLFLLIVLLLIAAGRQVLMWLRPSDNLTLLERNLFAFGLGLGIFGYAMLALGLCGALHFSSYLLLVLAIVASFSGMGRRMWHEVRQFKLPHLTFIGWGAATLFSLFAVTALVGVYSPPTQLEWDALAYHLADPKIYIQQGRIVPLPWESHSEFAFNTEMWYTFGLLNGGVPLAKWFHCACGIGAALTTYAFGRRFFSHGVGIVAALIFVSTPLVFWEAGAAYADLATTYFTAMTGLAVALRLAYMRQNDSGGEGRDITLSAVLMGFTLATKATALTTLGLLALFILFAQARQINWLRATATATAWGALALVIGCPYFVKSAMRTGNPIYPFYFQIFGGRNWSADRAKAYDASNAAFGQGRRPVDFLLLPYNLTMSLVPNHPLPARAEAPAKQSFNDQQNLLWTLSPVLLAALFFPLFSIKQGPPVLRPLALYALGAVLLWFLTAQHVRYLLPTLPTLCLLAAWTVTQAWEIRSMSGRVLVLFGGVSAAFSLAIAALLVGAQGPVALGLQSQVDYLSSRDPAYAAMQYLNTQTPLSAKVVLYGNPLGFYCNRTYFWGDRQHSAFVPYESFQAPADFLRWLQKQGVTYILVNRRYFNPAPSGGDIRAVYGILTQCGPPVYDAHGIQVYHLP